MEKQKLFFSKKENIYYYVTYGELSTCDICNKEIDRILVYHTSWRKRSEEIRTYHIKCYQKIFPRGFIDEFKTCVVIDEMPEDIHPVFERRPALANSTGASTFEAHKFEKGSEAEIKDRTRLAKDPNQWLFPSYDKNLRMFEKKEEELGPSIFLLQDQKRDELLQIEHKKKKENQVICKILKVNKEGIEVETLEKIKLTIEKDELPLPIKKYKVDQEISSLDCLDNINKIKIILIKEENIQVETGGKVRVEIKKEELPIPPEKYTPEQEVVTKIKEGTKFFLSLKNVEILPRKKVYPEKIEVKKVNIDNFFENVKSSEMLLPHQDFLELLSPKELNNKKFSIEDKSK